MKKSILILGGCGFIGSHVVDRFLAEGHSVRVLSRSPEIFRPPVKGVDYRFGELGNQTFLEDCLKGVEIVIHLVSTTTPKDSNEDMGFDIESNLVQTVRALRSCMNSRVEKLVYISSGGAIYGNPEFCPVLEDAPTSPLCSYGVVKLAIEKYMELFQNLYGLKSVALRVANPFGPRQNPRAHQGFVAATLDRIHKGLPISVWGDGSVVRDFFFVGDLAEAIYLAAMQETQSQVINIGSGVGMSLRELLEVVRQEIGLKFEVRYDPGRAFDVREIYLDIARAKAELGWEPQAKLGDALRETWDFIKRNHST
jgi:UDP-glucose 4-epimerase